MAILKIKKPLIYSRERTAQSGGLLTSIWSNRARRLRETYQCSPFNERSLPCAFGIKIDLFFQRRRWDSNPNIDLFPRTDGTVNILWTYFHERPLLKKTVSTYSHERKIGKTQTRHQSDAFVPCGDGGGDGESVRCDAI